MAKCKGCNKRGLFLKLQKGLCKSCLDKLFPSETGPFGLTKDMFLNPEKYAVKEEPIQREKCLISDGYFTDTKGNPFPVDSIDCVFIADGLSRIDHNFYEISSQHNIQIAKAAIIALNNCLNDAASLRSDFPAHRIIEKNIKFKFDPYAGTRNYCTISFENTSLKKEPRYCRCCLSFHCSDDLFGQIIYDSKGIPESARITSSRRIRIDYTDRITMDTDIYIVKMIPSNSGVFTLHSVKTTREIEQERQLKSKTWHSIHQKWQVVIDEHARLLNEIGVAYTIANNLNLPDSPQMQHVIDLCKQDIALAEMFVKSQLEIQDVRVANGWSEQKDAADVLPNFPTFKRLAIIYEKQKKYDEAIAVCQRAIELGFPKDGTDGQMPGRIARLMRKKGKDVKKIEPAEEVVIDDSTGKVIDS